MSVYFDRHLPLFLTTEPGFDAIKVDIDGSTVAFISDLNDLVASINEVIRVSGSPEDYNQSHAELFAEGLAEIWSNYNVPRQ
ncbi:hypothetical protein LCGC14_2466180 [marine sediment metagenome]|uniref:Uncharacterized protein n=1 Tax=marine sediment metagenome TaxID=412755 RepID=A0A0F9BZH4_9ZZZZ